MSRLCRDILEASQVWAVLIEEGDVLAVVLRQVLDEGLLALGEDLLELRVDLVALFLYKSMGTQHGHTSTRRRNQDSSRGEVFETKKGYRSV